MSKNVVVELAGLTRVLAGCTEMSVTIRDGATWRDVIAALACALPALVGEALAEDRRDLLGSYILNVGGRYTIQNLDDETSLEEGDRLALLDVGIC